MPKISNRGEAMPSSPIRKLVPFAEQAQKRGIKVLHLNIGQPDLPTPQNGLNVLKNLNIKTLAYSHSAGNESFRASLTKYYKNFNIDITKEEIIVTCGGSEAILFTFLACLNPGDEVIMPDPTYANYLGFAEMTGVVVKTVKSDIKSNFSLPNIEEFEKLITEKTKAILICNPNNPTGYVYNKEELGKLKDIVIRHNLFLIADEVYREFVYTDTKFTSILEFEELRNNAIVVDSVSKRYSECGIRIGMVVSHNKEVISTILKFAQCRLSPPLLGQIVAEASIDEPKEYSISCYNEYKARRDYFITELNKIDGVISPMPNGAFYTIAHLPVDDAEKFCKWCLNDFEYSPDGINKYTIMMAPACGFYKNPLDGKNQVRFAYILRIEDLKLAIDVLKTALKRYKNLV